MMMMNLFMSFDPSTIMFSLNWLVILLPLMYFPLSFYSLPSRFNLIWVILSSIMIKEFKNLINKFSYFNLIMFYSLLFMLIILNFMGLFPYIFSGTSHLSINLTLSLPLWLAIILFSWSNYTTIMLAHMVPIGTPSILMMMMVIIETISNLIRPFTLAIRLTANMIAGHLLLALTGSSSTNLFIMISMILIQFLLFTLEMSVSLIQSYVFSILSVLYSNEV